MKDKYMNVDEHVSTSRRHFVKKTVYSAPTLVVLGTLSSAGDWGNDSQVSPKSLPVNKQSINGLNNSQTLTGN